MPENPNGLLAELNNFGSRLDKIEKKLLWDNLIKVVQDMVTSFLSKAYTLDSQPQVMQSMDLALCVSTDDPLIENRVRFFHPRFHRPNVAVESLPFAKPINPFPSFDDSGLTWVPPAGSTICLFFQNGNPDMAFYGGSVWNRNRGNPPTWAFPVQEYETYWKGTRGGYLVGKNDETQVFPPWNTWNYNSFDYDSETDFETDPTAKNQRTIPHIYGHKTPEKAYVRHDDGDRNCNLKGKHTEICSSRGNFILFKDDHLHPAGIYAHPSGGCAGTPGDASVCGIPCADDPTSLCKETPVCCTCSDINCPGGPRCPYSPTSSRCSNKYFKRDEECRPYRGSPTPLNPRAWLPQSGIHIQSLSGHHIEFDDSVENPTGVPSWDRNFDFGCTDKFLGKLWIMSATGHSILLNDAEDVSQNRANHNGITLKTAAGNSIELNDHTVDKQFAGAERGVKITSTSNHILHFCDADNQQASPIRKNEGQPVNNAKNAFVLLRSGYGCSLLFKDNNSQQQGDEQYIELLAPQKGNERQDHVLKMQVRGNGPGQVLLRSGGVLWLSSYDNMVETVGENNNRAHKFVEVNGMHVHKSKEIYVNLNQLTFFKADDLIILAAGEDCEIPEDADDAKALANEAKTAAQNAIDAAKSGSTAPQTSPCLYPVMLGKKPWRCPVTQFIHFGMEGLSDRLFASSSKE
jgi:hypothetical protein